MIALLGMQPATAAIGSDIALVVRPDTPADDLSLGEVRDLLLGSGNRGTVNCASPCW